VARGVSDSSGGPGMAIQTLVEPDTKRSFSSSEVRKFGDGVDAKFNDDRERGQGSTGAVNYGQGLLRLVRDIKHTQGAEFYVEVCKLGV
jgi:hypothetical protein